MIKRKTIRNAFTMALAYLFVSAVLAIGVLPAKAWADTEEESGSVPVLGSGYQATTAISNDALDGVTVRLRPQNSTTALGINKDGKGVKNVVHVWEIGNSTRLLLNKANGADRNEYHVTFFTDWYNTSPDGQVWEPDVETHIFGPDIWSNDNAVIHVVEHSTSGHGDFAFVPVGDGLYKILAKISNMYLKVDDSNHNGIWENGENLVETKGEPTLFEMEIINPGGKDINSVKQYSSYNFLYGNQVVTSTNWMSFIPDDTPLTDLNIPGAHDAGTVSPTLGTVLDIVAKGMEAKYAQCQQLFYDDLLNAGIRCVDLRCNIESLLSREGDSPLINHSVYCADRDGTNLSMNDIWHYTEDFLNKNKRETVIWRITRQQLISVADAQNIYEYFEKLVRDNPSKFYIGDHVPTLGEVRGKIVILSDLSRAELSNQSQYDFNQNGIVGKWALDITVAEPNVDYSTAHDTVLIRQGSNYEVWVEDDYKQTGPTKWSNSTEPSLNKAYTHRDNAIAKGKYAWVFIYTSGSKPDDDDSIPLNIAKYTNQRVKKYFDPTLDRTPALTSQNGKYAGVMYMDFVDEQQCQFVYRQNFMMSMPKISTYQSGTTVDVPTYTEPVSNAYRSGSQASSGRAWTSSYSSNTSTETAASAWTRLGGSDRYETMSQIVSAGFTKSDNAVLVTGASFPDALSSSALAGSMSCPVILTNGTSLSAQAKGQLERLGVKELYIVGGDASVSDAVVAEVESMGIAVHRVAGDDRASTSVQVFLTARVLDSSSDTVIVATGDSFADALSIGSWSYATRSPIILARGGTIPDEAVEAIRSDPAIRRVVIVGGAQAVSDAVMTQLGDGYEYLRLAGADRYQTSERVAEWAMEHGLSSAHVCVATGANFPDALAGAALAGRKGAIILLEDGSARAERWLTARSSIASGAFVLGGASAVSEAVMDALSR